VYYWGKEWQKKDWKGHKKGWFGPEVDKELREKAKELKAEDFEVYREIGEGNFSKSKSNWINRYLIA
jgi:hypothetical protein